MITISAFRNVPDFAKGLRIWMEIASLQAI